MENFPQNSDFEVINSIEPFLRSAKREALYCEFSEVCSISFFEVLSKYGDMRKLRWTWGGPVVNFIKCKIVMIIDSEILVLCTIIELSKTASFFI